MSFGEVKTSGASASDEWETEPRLVQAIGAEYGRIVLDCAATPANALAPRYFTKETNALEQDWNVATANDGPGIHFINPPFSKPHKPLFTAKAIEQAAGMWARTNVLVLPANTRDRWFHDLVLSRVVGGFVDRVKLGKEWPAMRFLAPPRERIAKLLGVQLPPGPVRDGVGTTVWLLEGQVKFRSPLNPKNNGCPGGVAVVAFYPEV